MNKWKQKHADFVESFTRALTLQLKENDPIRTKIVNEILETLTICHPWRWFSCNVCNEWRPFERIDVLKKPILDDSKEKIGEANIRYCNDRKECIEGAKHYEY